MPSVYALFDPARPEHFRYVGVSSDPLVRLMQHLEEALTSSAHTYKLNWIRRVMRAGRTPDLRILCTEMFRANALIQEQHFIKEYKAAGHRLTNATKGGEGLFGTIIRKKRRTRKARLLQRTVGA